MKKIKNYTVVVADHSSMITAVNTLIDEGWQPLGGVALHTGSYTMSYGDTAVGVVFHQAMVLYED